jgi:hypothetical protein
MGLRQERVQLSPQRLEVIESQQRIGFRDVVTGDESWFLQHYAHRQIWCVSADEVPTRVTHKIAAPKSMLTLLLSVRGVVFTNWLPSTGNVESSYFCTELLEPRTQIVHERPISHSTRPIGHFDNAAPHRAAASESCFQRARFCHAPQPPYRPDICPCGFVLFGDFKTKLKGQGFETMEG